jgi:hypothetical protein
MAGKLVSLQNNLLLARVSGAGKVMQLRAILSIDQNTGAVTGTLRGTPIGGGR